MQKRDPYGREEATMLPPPGGACNFTLSAMAERVHSVARDGLPSEDCEKPECLVDRVHAL
jgi:hypothetical protein